MWVGLPKTLLGPMNWHYTSVTNTQTYVRRLYAKLYGDRDEFAVGLLYAPPLVAIWSKIANYLGATSRRAAPASRPAPPLHCAALPRR